MKKLMALTAMALAASMSLTALASETELPSADVAEQGYDFYEDAVSYNDIREDGRYGYTWNVYQDV